MNEFSKKIYDDIVSDIENNKYMIGDRLPSIRHTALFYNVKKYYVDVAYDKLSIEGYIISRKGKGFYINSKTGRYVININDNSHINNKASNTIIPMIRNFHKNTFFKKNIDELIYAGFKELNNSNANILFHQNSGIGNPRLREIIAEYLLKLYGLKIHPDQVLVSSSKNHIIDYLMSEYNLKSIFLEEPRTNLKSSIFNVNKYNIKYLPLDDEGVIVDKIPLESSILYIESFDQFPTGTSYSKKRKEELGSFCNESNIFIVENLYRKDFVFEKQQFMFNDYRTFLLGDMSGVFPISIKFAFLIMPKGFMAKNFKTEISSLTENFIINCFKDRLYYKKTEKLWKFLISLRNEILIEAEKRELDFRCTTSGFYLSIRVHNDKIKYIKQNLSLLPFNIYPQFFQIDKDETIFSFNYMNVNKDKIGEFLDFILYGKINTNEEPEN